MWLSIIGVIFFFFRVYVTEYKVARFISPENHYISRINMYFFSVAMIFSFQSSLLNIPIIAGFIPFSLIFLINDLKFIFNISYFMKAKRITKKIDAIWLLLERLTLHLPSIFIGGYMYLTDISNFISNENMLFSFVISYIISITSFIFLDIRWKDKKNPFIGRSIIFFHLISVLHIYFKVNPI